jgi:DNA-binding winged helix-turn-helix (wHTH) protein
MIYLFDDYILDTERYTLRRAGQDLPLERLAFDLLVYLLQHRDRLVSRDELQRQVWKKEFLSPNAVDQCVAVVRRTLTAPHSAQPPRFIETVRGRGYRFVRPVEESARDPADGAPRDEPPGHLPLVAPEVPPALPIPVRTPPGRWHTRRALVIIGLALAAAVLAVCHVWFWPGAPFPGVTHDGPERPGGAQVSRDPPPPLEERPPSPPPATSPPAAEAPPPSVTRDQDPTPEASPPAAEVPASPVRPAQAPPPPSEATVEAELRAAGWWCRRPGQSPCLQGVRVSDTGEVHLTGVLCAHHNFRQVFTLLRAFPGVTGVVTRQVNVLQLWSDALPRPRPLPNACRVPPWNHHPGSAP